MTTKEFNCHVLLHSLEYLTEPKQCSATALPQACGCRSARSYISPEVPPNFSGSPRRNPAMRGRQPALGTSAEFVSPLAVLRKLLAGVLAPRARPLLTALIALMAYRVTVNHSSVARMQTECPAQTGNGRGAFGGSARCHCPTFPPTHEVQFRPTFSLRAHERQRAPM
jgi:hypothetical protein